MQFALALTPVLILFPILAFLLPVLVRLLRSSQPGDLTMEWFESFHVSSYSPMCGLLAQDDFQFLSSQPGFDRSIHRKLRRDRLRIFREYLNRLIVDYNRLHTVATFVLSQSTEDQSQLFTRLLALRYRFWIATVQVEFSYLLCRLVGTSIYLADILRQVEEVSEIALRSPAKGLLVN